jgi:hypothetical protein
MAFLPSLEGAHRDAQPLDASLQLAPPAPWHRRVSTGQPLAPNQKQPDDALHNQSCVPSFTMNGNPKRAIGELERTI